MRVGVLTTVMWLLVVASASAYGVSEPIEMSVPMSDGVTLTADVYVPTDEATGEPAQGSFPVVLAQTPYGKRSAITTRGSGKSETGGDGYYPYLVERGYVNAVVEVRGTGASEGEFELFGRREVQDGVELVDWAARLPHSNGRVGGAGESYLGINQLLTAAAVRRGSPLKAIFPVTAGNDLYRDISFMGGIPNAEFAVVFAGLRAGMIPGPDAADRARRYAELDGDLYSEINLGGARGFDHPFWQERSPRSVLPKVVANGIPAFMVGGWGDVYQRGAPLNYRALQQAFPGRAPTGRYQLAVGPWFHNSAAVGLRLQELQLEWFDRWLKGVDNGIERTRRPLHVFAHGDNRWYDAASYPLEGTRVKTLEHDGGGTLAFTATSSPCNRGTDQWSTGLAAYVEALAGQPSAPPCSADDRTTQAGALTFDTAPLERPLFVAGPLAATVVMTSTTRDSELVVSVQDVAPDGSSFPLTHGALLGSHRAVDRARSIRAGRRTLIPWHPFTEQARRPLEPGVLTEQQIELPPTVARIAAGHRLRMTIASGTTALAPTPVQLRDLAGGVYAIERASLDVPAVARLAPSQIDYGACNGGCRP
jgi:uncharacterized protein